MNEREFRQRFFQLRSKSRCRFDFAYKGETTPAAILIPVMCRDNLTILLTRRARHLHHHPGQISFPGGRHETADSSLIDTALREAQEEIALEPNHVTVLGQLPASTTISGFSVTPVVAMISPNAVLEPDHSEVDEVFEVPVSHFLQKDNFMLTTVYRQNQQHEVCFVPYNQYQIWGITAGILYQLRDYMLLQE